MPMSRTCVPDASGVVVELHVIVFNENSLRRTLNSYFDYYHRSRAHLSLGKDSPEPRAIQPPEMGSVVALPQVGGLHHRYERRAALKSQSLPGCELPPLGVLKSMSGLCSVAQACIVEFHSLDSDSAAIC
jgi:hypothetical protein